MRPLALLALVCISGCGDDAATPDAPPCLCDAAPSPDAPAGLTPIEAYDQAWHTEDEAARLALLEAAVTDDVYYVDPTAEVTGRAALSALMVEFQAQVPGGTIPLTTGIDQVFDHARYGWEVRDAQGTAFVDGIDHVVLAADGRLARIEGYWNAAAGTPSPQLAALYDVLDEADATARGAALDAAVTADVSVTTPNATGSDVAVLDLWIQTQLSSGTFEITAGPELLRPHLARASWRRVAGDGTTELSHGEIYTVASTADGRITAVTVFVGDYPLP